MTSKVIEGHKSSSNFSLNPTPNGWSVDASLPNCVYFSFSHSQSLSLFPSLSLTHSLYPSLPPSFAPWKH